MTRMKPLDPEDFAGLRAHFTEEQVVEIVAVVSLYGFFNRFNDTMATPLEGSAAEFAEASLGRSGWQAGKHA